MTATYEIHPLAELFPPLDAAGINQLAEDIKERGLQEPVTLYENKIIDGRNRQKACLVAGVELRTRTYEGDDPIGFVLSANFHRRMLNENQRAMVGAALAKLKLGDNQHTQYTKGISAEKAAKLLNVGTASIERAKRVLASGDAKLIAEVQAGNKSVTAAADEAAKGTRTKKNRSDKIDGLAKSLIKELKAWKGEDVESAITATANLIDQLKAADLIEDKKGRKAA